jgi:hypothetical protein
MLLTMPLDMRAICDQLQRRQPPVLNPSALQQLSPQQLSQLLMASGVDARVSADAFLRALHEVIQGA